MTPHLHDVVIIGAGPAGIQAAIHAARKKADVLVLGRIENSALYWAHVENYAFVEGIQEGKNLLATGHRQMEKFGARQIEEDVLKITKEENSFKLELESGKHLNASTLIFAMGVSKKKLSVPGENELVGRGVSYCVDCDANFFRGATVAVVGDRSAAVDGALTLLEYADKVYLVAKELRVSPELEKRLAGSRVEVLAKTWVKEIEGENSVSGIILEDGSRVALDGVFIELGSKGALELATQIGVELDTEQFKYINTNRRQETNIPGVYAAGDIVGPPYQIAKAVGEGCVAGMEAAALARRMRKQESS